MSELKLSVPSLPAYRARWAPIYLEPIAGSGERIAVAIVVSDERGTEVVRTVRDEALRSIFGAKRAHVSAMIEAALAHARQLKAKDATRFPMTGFFVGDWNEASSRQERFGVLRQAVYRSCFLANIEDLDADEEDLTPTESTKQWLTMVRKEVIEKRPDLSNGFNREIKLISDGIPPRIGFLFQRRAANFDTLRPNSLSNSMRSARAKLYELMKVKEKGLLDVGRLILGAPRQDDITYGEKLLAAAARAQRELEHEANSDQLEVRHATTVDQAALEVLDLAA